MNCNVEALTVLAGEQYVKAALQQKHSHLLMPYCMQALEPGAKLGDHAPSSVYEARAYAHIKLQQWMEAVQDASKAVELDPNNAKAYLRKG